MSIRLIARELYRAQQAVDRIRKALAGAPPEERERLSWQLRAAEAERDRMQRMLEGQKDDANT